MVRLSLPFILFWIQPYEICGQLNYTISLLDRSLAFLRLKRNGLN